MIATDHVLEIDDGCLSDRQLHIIWHHHLVNNMVTSIMMMDLAMKKINSERFYDWKQTKIPHLQQYRPKTNNLVNLGQFLLRLISHLVIIVIIIIVFVMTDIIIIIFVFDIR